MTEIATTTQTYTDRLRKRVDKLVDEYPLWTGRQIYVFAVLYENERAAGRAAAKYGGKDANDRFASCSAQRRAYGTWADHYSTKMRPPIDEEATLHYCDYLVAEDTKFTL